MDEGVGDQCKVGELEKMGKIIGKARGENSESKAGKTGTEDAERVREKG